MQLHLLAPLHIVFLVKDTEDCDNVSDDSD